MGSIAIDLDATNTGDKSTMDQYLAGLPSKNFEPLWNRMSAMVPPTPNPIARPHLWKYSSSLPDLETAAKLVPEEQAERRVLMLVNPSLPSPHTTDTIYGGLQIVKPGETAPAHRHIAFACRFIIDGEGFTAVEGKKMPLRRGDVVVTPTWHWHDHGNESDKPVIWLDMLNLPLFTYARVHFAEGYAEKRYPSTFHDPSDWRFPWEPVGEDLDSQAGDHAVYHYKTKEGRELSTTLGMQAERISPRKSSEVCQDSSSFIYHCYEGRGHTVVETPSGERQTFEWESRDTFAIPAWSKIQHFNDSTSEEAYLVAVNDSPFLNLLGLRHP
ncbi:RmlC-like cupin [Phaeosphaeriaceae sp. SRC1lsM3a]|nr:RmlC-like cupin [Stagonospora sp. SRC1lsM3a]